MIHIRINRTKKTHFLIILSVGLLLRLLLSFVFDAPAIMGDTCGYLDLSHRLCSFDLKGYEGWRTPGYPLLILICFFNNYLVVIIQSLLSIISSFLVYDIIEKRNTHIALVTSLFVVTLLNCISFDFAILTESLTQFLMTLTIWFIYKKKILSLQTNIRNTLYLSLLLMLLFLVRPMYIFIPPIIVFFMVFHINKNRLLPDLTKIIVILSFPFLAYFGWNHINYINQNWRTTTTFLGINLAQNSYGFIDKLPDDEKLIKDIYIKHKLPQDYEKKDISKLKKWAIYYFRETNDAMTIWRAYDELLKNTNLTGPQLSKKMSVIFKEHIKKHPVDYSKQVIRSWTHYWNFYDYFKIKNRNTDTLPSPWCYLWTLQRLILLLFNLLFFPLSLLSIVNSMQQKSIFCVSNFIIAIIYASSILQALVTFGENSRFAFPTLFLIIIIDIIIILKTVKNKSKHYYF